MISFRTRAGEWIRYARYVAARRARSAVLRRVEPFVARLVLRGVPRPAVGVGPVALLFHGDLVGGSLAPVLQSLVDTVWAGHRPVLFFASDADANAAGAWARDLEIAGGAVPWELRDPPEPPIDTVEDFAAALRARLAAVEPAWVGLVNGAPLFHPEWLVQLSKVATSETVDRAGYWITRFAVAHPDPAVSVALSPLARVAGEDGTSALIFAQTGDSLVSLVEMVPGAAVGGPIRGEAASTRPSAALSLAIDVGLVRARTCALPESHADDLAFHEARAALGPARPAVAALRADGWGSRDLEALIPYNYYRFVQPKDLQPLDGIEAPLSLDVVIPAIPRDLPVLPWAIAGVRANLDHPTGRVIVVGPDVPALREACAREACDFVDERAAAPVPREAIHRVFGGLDRRGWIFQQLVKLNTPAFATHENVLILDSDTVLLRPQRFVGPGRCRLRCSDEYHPPYFRMFERLMGFAARARVSFVAHHMVFNAGVLARLKAHIERRSGRSWYQAILEGLDPHEAAGFSEYETYGNWLLHKEDCEVSIQYWCNITSRRLPDPKMRDFLARAARGHDSASFHYHSVSTP